MLKSSFATTARRRESAYSFWRVSTRKFVDSPVSYSLRSLSSFSFAARVLASADAFTERVVKGEKALYRARFAGFEKDEAEAACNYLKRNDIACMPLRN